MQPPAYLKIAQSITSYTIPGGLIVSATPRTVSAVSNSGLTVAFASSTPSVCTVSGTSLTLLSAGTCTLTLSQAGDSTYAAARTLTLGRELTIS